MGNVKLKTNSKGQVIEEKTYGFLGLTLERTVKYTYDEMGRVTFIEVIQKDGKRDSTTIRYDPSGYVERLHEDLHGNKRFSFEVYNSSNEVILSVGELEGRHKYCNKLVYDRDGRPAKFRSTYSRETDIKTAFLQEFEILRKEK